MNHPLDQLLAYALGELDAAEILALEDHLEGCASCREELATLQANMVRLVESLPATVPPEGTWQAISTRIAAGPQDATGSSAPVGRQPVRRWQRYALAASLVLALLGGAWGVSRQQRLRAVQAEQTVVGRWLSREDVKVSFIEPTGDPVGSVLFLPDGRALLVLRDDPPSRQSYQAWGLREGEAVSLGVTTGRTLHFDSSGFDSIGISLEPGDGSTSPTLLVGGAPVL